MKTDYGGTAQLSRASRILCMIAKIGNMAENGNMKRIFLFLIVVSCLFCAPALAWRGVVVSVNDGDSLRVRAEAGGSPVSIRLYGVDAPESPWKGRWKAQPYYKTARDKLRELLPTGVTVTVHDMGLDKYGRTVGSIVTLPDGRIVQEELLVNGLVWIYPKYCKDCRQWRALEEEARAARRGLWRGGGASAPVAPWLWRKGAWSR